jgi:hypothetical protein
MMKKATNAAEAAGYFEQMAKGFVDILVPSDGCMQTHNSDEIASALVSLVEVVANRDDAGREDLRFIVAREAYLKTDEHGRASEAFWLRHRAATGQEGAQQS